MKGSVLIIGVITIFLFSLIVANADDTGDEKGRIGQSCFKNSQCESNYCLFDPLYIETGVCACQTDNDCSQCVGFKLVQIACVKGVCMDIYDVVPVCDKRCNASCETDSDCISGSGYPYECNTDTCKCEIIKSQCRGNDGWIKDGECDTKMPRYCDNGTLINNCSFCGCDGGYICQLDGSCLPDYERMCLEVFPGYNDENATNRINVVFIGYNYTNEQELKERIIELINIDGTGAWDDRGLLSETPFRDYQDKFNLWFVNKTIFSPGAGFIGALPTGALRDFCPSYENKQSLFLIKTYESHRSYAGLGAGWLVLYDMFHRSITFNRDTLLHEFGHSFGGLYDEYIVHYYSSNPLSNNYPNGPNCDIANETTGCPKWCSGEPIHVEELESAVCSDANDSNTCYIKSEEQNLPCEWLGDNGVFNKTGCVNIVSLCTSVNDRNICLNSSGNFWMNNLCVWSYYLDPYFKSHCIPSSSASVNIGRDCIDDTECIQGCTVSNWFRSSLASKMRVANAPWNYINEQHLISLLESLDNLTAGELKTAVSENIIIYEEFDEEGNIAEGGIIDLDDISNETLDKIDQYIEQKTGETILGINGKIGVNKVNPVLLVEAIDNYLEYKESGAASCTGCMDNRGDCLPIGTRTEDNYCGLNNKMNEFKIDNSYCNNNFECKSNVCVSGECISEGLIKRLINWFERLFGRG